MKAFVRGMGWITAAGMGMGRTGSDFAMSEGEIPAIDHKEIFSDAFPRFGRLDPFSRLGLCAVALALKDAGLERWQHKRGIGLIASTVLGCLSTDMAYYQTVIPDNGALASPNLFAYTLSNIFLGEAAIRFGLTGSGIAINEGVQCLTAIRMAMESLAWGECPVMVAGFCDIACPEQLGILPKVAPGAAFVVLELFEEEKQEISGPVIAADDEGRIWVGKTRVEGWIELIGKLLKRS